MPDIYGSHFEFGGQSSRRYKLILANVTTERLRALAGQIASDTVFNRKSKQRYLINNNYNDSPLTLDVDILTDDDTVLGKTERRDIKKWLFNRHEYQKFYIDLADDIGCETFDYIDGERKRLFMFCRFLNPEKLEYNGGIVGYKATLEADSGYWWQDPIVKTFTLNHSSSSDYTNITLTVDSDIDDYIYPRVVFYTTGTGDVKITNLTDDSSRTLHFEAVPSGSFIALNSETSSVTPPFFSKLVNYNFPRLLDGINTLQITGAISTIAFQFSNRRML